MARRVRVRLTDGMRGLLNDPGVTAAVKGEADKVLREAQDAAPVKSGRYRESLGLQRVTVTPFSRSKAVPRAGYAVGSTAPYALAVEANHGVLSRALDAAS